MWEIYIIIGTPPYKKGILDINICQSYLSMKTYIVGTHWNRWGCYDKFNIFSWRIAKTRNTILVKKFIKAPYMELNMYDWIMSKMDIIALTLEL